MNRFLLILSFVLPLEFVVTNYNFYISKKEYENREYSKSKRQLIESIEISENAKDTISLLKSLFTIEDIYSKLGQYDSAILICYKRLNLNKLQKNYKSLSDNFRALNTLLITNLESNAVRGLMDSCYHYALLSKDSNTIIVATTNYGSYKAAEDKFLGLKYLHAAVKKSENCINTTIYLYSRVQAAEVLISIDSLPKAKEYLNQALNKAIEKKEKIQRAHIYMALARISIKEQNFEEAINTLHIAKRIAEQEPCIYYLPDIYQSLAQVFRTQKNIDSSFYYNDKANQAQKILVNEKTNIQVAEVNAKYQLEGKQNIIEILGSKVGVYRMVIYSIVILFVLTLTFLGLYILKLSRTSKFFENNRVFKSARRKEKDIPASLKERFSRIFIDQEVYTDSELTLQKLAELLDTNTTYLSRFINDEYKINFSQLLNQYRVEKTCTLMKDSKLNNIKIEALALNAGFKSKSTFNVAFKKQKGLTPTQWRGSDN